MSRETAHALWGEDVVRLALSEAEHEPLTAELADEIRRRADPPGAFRAWALARPWPRFCGIVRVVSGEVRREALGGGDGGED